MRPAGNVNENQRASLLAYFDGAALNYPQAVEPAFAPLAEALVRYAALQPGEQVIDLGTGSGLAARLAAGEGRFVAALDLSHKMLLAARQQKTPHLIRADLHRVGLRADVFDVALAAFAFNSTDPTLSLREAHRILRPGGRLVLHEWGVIDPLSELVSDTIAGYAVEEAPPELATLREAMDQPLPWDDIEDEDDLLEALQEAGFARIEIESLTIPVRLPDVGTFIRYKLAWPSRRAELAAMPDEIRRLCLHDLEENLAARAENDGGLLWQPVVVRARACKPARG